MNTAAPLARTSLRAVAIGAIGGLLIAGVVSVAPTPASPASAAVALPDGATDYKVSQTTAGTSTEPYITPDGQQVFFTSTASNLVTGDGNGVADVFGSVAIQGSDDPFTGQATLVSVPDGPAGATHANGASGEPVASADGRYVAFTSTATNLVPAGGTAGRRSVYVRDTLLNKTFRVQGASEPDGASYDPDITDDGHVVVFTSEATNLSTGDVNGAPDSFIANLDANGDGVVGDIQIARFVSGKSLAGGTQEARISGNGEAAVFTAHLDDLISPTPASGTFVYYSGVSGMQVGGGHNVMANAHSPSIDATGDSFAFLSDDACDGLPTVVAAAVSNYYYMVAVGQVLTDRRVGTNSDPVISADGSHVTWTTTIPDYDFTTPASALTTPVVRYQDVGWWDSDKDVECSGITGVGRQDVATGGQASLSASGRTIAYSGPNPASASVFAMDTHSHDGLSVSSNNGPLQTTGFMTALEIQTIPLTSLRGYASAIANAPIHRLPIHRLPIHRLPIHRLPIHRLLIEDSPIHRLPIHRLPIHRLDLPGGWEQVLADTPFAGELVQSVTLDEVLDWAAATLAPGSGATDAERAAAQVIQSLTLDDLGLDDSGLDALTLASFVLGSASLAQVPIAGTGTPLERWQALLNAQGIDLTIDDTYFLADLDAAGLDIEHSGIDAVPLHALPIDSTLLGDLLMSDMFLAGTPLGSLDVSTLTSASRVALFGTDAVSGTLASNTGSFLTDATAADFAAGAPDSVTVGLLLLSMLDADSYPWEQISPSSINPSLMESSTTEAGCDGHIRCTQSATFQFTFDPGPGEPTTFAAPTASVTMPTGTAPTFQYISASGPAVKRVVDSPYSGPKQVQAEKVSLPLPETAGGTVYSIETYYTSTTLPSEPHVIGELTSGDRSATAHLSGDAPIPTFDDPDRNYADGVWQNGPPTTLSDGMVYYEWLSPSTRGFNDEQQLVQGPAQDEDYYLVTPPGPGKRLVVSTNATDGQLSLALYAPGTVDPSLGVQNAGPTPGTPVTEQSGGDTGPAESGADAGAEVAGQTLIDQAVVRSDGTAEVEAASAGPSTGQPLMVRVTSGNGEPSSSLYSLRVQYVDETPEVHCSPWTPAQTADPGQVGASDAVTASTNTVYLFDQQRYGDTYGAAAAGQVRAALSSLTGKGHVGAGAVAGAVLTVDSDPAVQSARATLDENPCSMQAREALTSAINQFVHAKLGGNRDHIASIVIVGGDDIIPLAPVGQHTSQFNETSHAADLRLSQTPAGDPCPVGETVDPCETPLSAAAATSHILTDDPYGLATAYQSLGGFLYVPSVATGRLVETPAQILATVGRFVSSDGILQANSTLTGGYGAWSELPQEVTSSLAWRSPDNHDLGDTWDATALEDQLFPAGGESARVVSVNTHADETRMLPGVPGAESGVFSDADLFTASGHENAAQLAGSLIFGLGCHAGNNLPSAYYGDVADWVDVFSAAGGYVGNTGYGLANNVTTALSERLLTLYADWVGVSVDGTAVSSAGALTYAKQSYLGGLGLYSGYDEKALMEAVYYGLPMYSFDDATKEAPLPPAPALTPASIGGLATAGLTFHPTFETHFVTNDEGEDVEYLTVADQPALASPGQPVIASIATTLPQAPAGTVARGALLTSLTSQIDTEGTPAVTAPSVGVSETSFARSGAAFPSTFATITSQQTPAGPVDLMVVTPSRVQTTFGGKGITERFTDFHAEVVYGDASSTDTTSPTIDAIEMPFPGGDEMTVHASDPSAIAAVVLLVQPEDSTDGVWQRADVDAPTSDSDGWDATVPTTPFRWILQVVDGAGNVTTDSARGHLDIAGAPAPTLGDPGPEATVTAGDRLQRPVDVTDATPNDDLTASVAVNTTEGQLVSSSPATVETGPDGTTRALIDQPFLRGGSYVVTLTVCRDEACTSATIDVDVPLPNARPAVEVTLHSDDARAFPTSTLTAVPAGSDPENDAVSFTYAWARNGVPITGQQSATLALDGIASADDIITVTVTPADAGGAGHAASADVLVEAEPVPPAPPTISVVATKADGSVYQEGTWSRSPVTVTFTCTAASPLTAPCPAPITVDHDTAAAGVTVSGSITDLFGRTVSAAVVVKYDGTAPTLAPVVTPSSVPVGGTAVATPNATDASSGVATQSCATPQTTTAGTASVLCQAADVAGNTATKSATYTVVAPVPAKCAGWSDRSPQQPLNADGTSVFLRSSGVPVIFRACDARGKQITTKGFVKKVTQLSSAALPTSAKVNELWYPALGDFSYVKLVESWVGQIPTATLASGKKYTYRIDLSDGTSFTVTFGVR